MCVYVYVYIYYICIPNCTCTQRIHASQFLGAQHLCSYDFITLALYIIFLFCACYFNFKEGRDNF